MLIRAQKHLLQKDVVLNLCQLSADFYRDTSGTEVSLKIWALT